MASAVAEENGGENGRTEEDDGEELIKESHCGASPEGECWCADCEWWICFNFGLKMAFESRRYWFVLVKERLVTYK